MYVQEDFGTYIRHRRLNFTQM